MPFYYTIDSTKPEERRIADKLLVLREALSVQIPERTIEETLLLATWNIREFDSSKFGARGKEPLFYIAEIISRFDLVAVQEVHEDLTALKALMRILGSWWEVVFTDIKADADGNRERMAFLYDSRKLRFGGLAGQVVVPTSSALPNPEQLARTPFMLGFQAGWFKFSICTAHIYYGKAIANEPKRLQEIKALARTLRDRATSQHAWAKNMILLGDFNIFEPTDVTFAAITSVGFKVPESLQKLPSNAGKNKHYDQIAFFAPDADNHLEECRSGVFDFYETVYRAQDESTYAASMGEGYSSKPADKRSRYYKDWRTHQMSDHLPMWIELKIDFGTEYLKKKAGV